MEYWMFILFSSIIFIVLGIIDQVVGSEYVIYTPPPTDLAAAGGSGIVIDPIAFGVLQSVYWLAVLIPSIAVAVRRYHDIGRTGWWWLLNFVPCVGWVVLFIFAVLPGTDGDNNYGPNPIQGNA
jgi:uncharacterized membrane protein YhaH (DUF805 family)